MYVLVTCKNEEDQINKSSGPLGLREEDFFLFYYRRTMGDDEPRDVANLDPRGMIGRIYVEYHLTLLHTKYTSFRPCGFEKSFNVFFHYKPMADNDAPGASLFGPQGHDW